MKIAALRRTCALCERTIKYKERLWPEHLEEYKNNLTDPWLCGIIEEANYQYTVSKRDVRTKYSNGLVSLDSVSELELSRGRKI